MALNPIEDIVFSVIDLMRGSITVAIPLFFLLLVGQWLRKRIEKETKWSWMITALITTYLIIFVLLLVAFFLPFLIASQEQTLGEVPSIFAPSLTNLIAGFLFGVLRVALVAGVLTLILLPLEFVGAYFHEVVSKKLEKSPNWLKLLVTAYITSIFSSAIIIFFIPEAVTGFFYLLYFGFG